MLTKQGMQDEIVECKKRIADKEKLAKSAAKKLTEYLEENAVSGFYIMENHSLQSLAFFQREIAQLQEKLWTLERLSCHIE